MLTAKVVVLLILVTEIKALPTDTELQKQWEDFKTLHKKIYHQGEESRRKLIWAENLEKVRKHNKEAEMGKHTFTLGINEYSDMSHEEINSRMHGYRESSFQMMNSKHEVKADMNEKDLPKEVNWKAKGWVTPVGNQFQCGSCWAFTANGAVEGQHYNVTGQLVPLSSQNLMDCSDAEGNHACEGGTMIQSYKYIIKNKGVDTQTAYPYTGKNGKCHFKRTSVGATLTGYGTIKKGSELALQKAVATIGPIAVAVDGEKASFGMYKSGIYNEPTCSQNVDHSLLVVGYGTLNGTDYWLMKNSWGTSWGMDGYIMMSRNKGNQCGVANMGSYPIA
ncbi:procathepsin L-like [Ylistrum balloti]|uniref:procathepsin L-like n=1 Tax=Ylistrum balloti TaxID=509963 RepID=UPI002905AED2|nr:procathepsin L-like [Ylistrum balloti]